MEKQVVLHHLAEEMAAGEEAEYMKALCRGFARLHPDTELVWLSLPKGDPALRREILDAAIQMLPNTSAI